MAICDDCKLDMADATTMSCTPPTIQINGVYYARLRYGYDQRAAELPEHPRCHDCYVAWGGLHHYGCDMEECPRCHGQLISCGCNHDGCSAQPPEKPAPGYNCEQTELPELDWYT